MEKSGPWSTHPEIIDRQDLKSRGRKMLESFITLAFWTGFVYLLVPLVTLCLWMFGVQIAYTQLIGAHGLDELIKIIKGSGIMVFFITLMILGWGYYNYLLFRIRGERRNSQVLICYDEDFSALYHLDIQTLQVAKEQSRLLVTLANGRVAVRPAPGPMRLTVAPGQSAPKPITPPYDPAPSLPEGLSGTWSEWPRKKAGGRK
jgi:poly-beta-1,6-N-acetyl-D-glucosamine biosynthesis protein PgaD